MIEPRTPLPTPTREEAEEAAKALLSFLPLAGEPSAEAIEEMVADAFACGRFAAFERWGNEDVQANFRILKAWHASRAARLRELEEAVKPFVEEDGMLIEFSAGERSRVAELEALLLSVEWSGRDGYVDACPSCGWQRKEDHKAGCMLAAAIEKIGATS